MISLKVLLKKSQYNYYMSGLVLLLAKPLVFFFRVVLRRLVSMSKVNGKTIRYAGVLVRFPKNVGINFQSEVYWHGTSAVEPHTVKLLKMLFSCSDIFLDVGSNFGIYSLMARRVNNKISVLSFEPLENIANDFILFQRCNELSADGLYKLALSDISGEAVLNVPDAFHVASEISSSSLESDFFYNLKFNQATKKILRIRLDDFWKQNPMLFNKTSVVIKIDVEGHEAKVLRGGREFMTKFRPWIVVEVDKHEERLIDFIKEIETLGYWIYAITGYGYFNIPLSQLYGYHGEKDFLLIPRSAGELPSFFADDLLIGYFKKLALNE